MRLESRIFFSRFGRRLFVFGARFFFRARFVSETRRLGDDTSVTGGLNRLHPRMMSVHHVPYNHNSTREMARRRGFLFLRKDARFSLTTRLAFPVRARAALVALV